MRKKIMWCGIVWEQIGADSWRGSYGHAGVKLHRYSPREWDVVVEDGKLPLKRPKSTHYETRREAIEGIKVIVEFMGGKDANEVAMDVLGCSSKSAKVEAHLRRWL